MKKGTSYFWLPKTTQLHLHTLCIQHICIQTRTVRNSNLMKYLHIAEWTGHRSNCISINQTTVTHILTYKESIKKKALELSVAIPFSSLCAVYYFRTLSFWITAFGFLIPSQGITVMCWGSERGNYFLIPHWFYSTYIILPQVKMSCVLTEVNSIHNRLH